MSNILYTNAKESLLTASIDWINDTFKVVLIDTDEYTSNGTTDVSLADVPIAARVATSPALDGKSVSGGIAIASSVIFESVTGAVSEAIAIYKEGADEASSPLVAYIDSAQYLPITPNGGDIIVDWNGGTGEIFSL